MGRIGKRKRVVKCEESGNHDSWPVYFDTDVPGTGAECPWQTLLPRRCLQVPPPHTRNWTQLRCVRDTRAEFNVNRAASHTAELPTDPQRG